ncbi:GAF and ANTAR domain-containing protein [Mycolicibacterium novocastrense]|uniref:GAF and ANTAR domain-containing protein n=1 Tax=Mycolicibacterium novocastrense TaxID=59813 RepID=A0AAW5SSB3_MYCNV|nr:GAF and ANTAR domain-containing protein [Mycolicibacterium novocastrense]MCV7026475.1 GAF and ANTAR domain-containing protein [Mycolicibacterium novocastrense]GAT08532.1 response regulator receiver/ANTAR domain-containing protein [Mycolicibacterium novocastrense]
MAVYDAQPGRRSATEADLSAAQRDADEADLYAGLTGVAGLVAGSRQMTDLLADVAQFAARAIPGVDGAGIALKQLRDGAPRIEAWAATAPFVNEIDSVQYEQLHEGPCLTAMQSGRPTVSGSLGCDSRWPHFGGRVARMAVHSALSLPLLVDETVVGAINAYARARDAFSEHAVQLGTQFAGPAAVSVYNGQLLDDARERTQQLQRALGTRAVIDQAIGIIRSRSGASAEEAFDRLTRLSQTQNVKLHTVAERLVVEAVRRAKARNRP